MRVAGLSGLALVLLSACGPMDLDMAENSCIERAQLAQRPRGQITAGFGSGGRSSASFDLGISSDYLMHRDPDQVFADCVQQRAGQAPSRPFSSRPESRM